MTGKMYIPLSITFTEYEYLILTDLMKDLELEDSQFSEAMRKIVREWHQWHSQMEAECITSRERKAPTAG